MAEDDKQKQQLPPERMPIKGRFDQYRSSYWAAAVAVLGLRYGARPFVRHLWTDAYKDHWFRQGYAAIAGGIMYGVTALYARATYKDMKSIFAEAVAAEFDKKPEDVTIKDIWASKNSAVVHTRENYTKYNLRRFGINTVFFTPYLPWVKKLFKPNPESSLPFLKEGFHPESGADFGIAANALYLFSDVLGRKATFFETLQTVVDREVNHTERPDERVSGSDLLNLYERNIDKRNPELSFTHRRGTPAWDKSMNMFGRMADLMNQTYQNKVPTEKASFGFPEFIFLIGHGMIDPANVERSCAYIELANQHGMKAVKQVSEAVKRGASFEKAAEAYNVKLPAAARDCAAPAATFAEKCGKKDAPDSLVAREALRRAEPVAEGIALN